jgi:outer membrane protein OmpA-like peptidoglycan-associated protein
MKINKSARIIGVVILGAAGLAACATPGDVKKSVAAEDTKVSARMDNMDQNTRDAMARAEAAHKLAEGKFLYSMVLSDDSVKFPTNGHQLSPEAETRLTDFANKLKADNRNVYLEIQGHTDSTGSKAYNMELGSQRAEAVRLFMNKSGVPLNRMSTISYGDSSPVAPNDNPTGRAQNRRVVVIVMS